MNCSPWGHKEPDTERLSLSHFSLSLLGIVRDFGMDRYTLLYLKWITNKDLVYSMRNSAQCYVAAWMGRVPGGEEIHAYAWLSPFAVHLKLSQYRQLAIPQYKIKSLKFEKLSDVNIF